MPAVTTITSMTSNWSPPRISWSLGSNTISRSGQILMSAFDVNGVSLTAACQKLVPVTPPQGPGDPFTAALSCMQSAGFRQAVNYQPGWRYWPFQGIDTGIYLLLAAALVAVAWYVVRRRDA